MMQKDIMLRGEGDAWFMRNRDKLGDRDPVGTMIETAGLKPQRVLEVGCSNGWRLKQLRDKYGCIVVGFDPSKRAVDEARALLGNARVMWGTADDLFWTSAKFDLVIYGFCLYLADPEDYLKIAASGNQLLADRGHLIIHDFYSEKPFKRQYEHDYRVFAHHFDPAALWAAHPAYRRLAESFERDEYVCLLTKDLGGAFSLEAP